MLTVVLGIGGTLLAIAAVLGATVAVLRSTALKTTVELQEGTIKALQQARVVDAEVSAQRDATYTTRIAVLESRAAALEGFALTEIAKVVTAAVLAGFAQAAEVALVTRPAPAKRAAPRRRAASS